MNELPPSDEVFKQLSGSFFHHFAESFLNGKNERSQKLAIFLFIVILAYAGVEAVKIFFRSNFGKKGLDIWKWLLSLVAFIAIGIIALNDYLAIEQYSTTLGNSKDFLLHTSVFYFVLALLLLVKGIIEFRKKKTNPVHPSYRGDSTVLGFLGESGWKQAKIQNLAEPLLVLAVGIFLSPINLLLGLPLVFCAISVWIHYAYEAIRGLLIARNQLSDKQGFPEHYGRKFSRVVN